ncbi:MAG: hypothetical protein JWP08_4021 [Bryobacterales bacterium]|jgi:hypothetical protein|nr:hypothetical protein [Bryobacterales bacterium]
MKTTRTIGSVICGLILTFTLNAQQSHINGELSTAKTGAAPSTATPGAVLAQPTRGVVFKTAAINSDGSPASCFRCDGVNTTRLGVGQYQVAFDEDVEATNGWARWIQVDTLGFGSSNAWCTTADRFGVPNAIFVSCQAPGGPGSGGNSTNVDVSFFVFVAR